MPEPTDGDVMVAATPPPGRLRRHARRREQRRQAGRERYNMLDLAQDVMDVTLDVLFFWR